MAKPAFTEHPKFMEAGRAANGAPSVALAGMGLADRDLNQFDVTADRLVDDLTKLLLRAYDAKQKHKAKDRLTNPSNQPDMGE